MTQKSLPVSKLREMVKEELLREMGEEKKKRSVHEVIVDITKAGSNGLKAIKALRTKKMPTRKSQEMVDNLISALQAAFEEMLRNPVEYLDSNPGQVVRDHLQNLDNRESEVADKPLP